MKASIGAIVDTRPEVEKQKDFMFSEMVSSYEPVNWVEKKEWRSFPIFNQGKSEACVAFSLAKILGVMHQINEGEWIDFSAGFIYQQRANKPFGGMAGVDAWEIVRKNGCLLEDLFCSQNKDDLYIDNYQVKQYERDIAAVFKINNYVILPVGDIEAIASVIQKTGKAVMVWHFWNVDEYNRTMPVVLYDGLSVGSAQGRHSTAAVDFTLKDGKKCLVIEDSWGKAENTLNGQRLITEEFHKKRNFFAAYPINFKFQAFDDVPRYIFTKQLSYGMIDKDVVALQNALKYLGYFPSNVESTGHYLGLTANAVYKWQTEYKVAPIEELDQLKGRVFGDKSIIKMNELLK